MINLEKISGLPIQVTEEYKLKFKPPLGDFPMTFARKFSEMVPVLMDPTIKAPIEITYPVYRGIHLPEHNEIVTSNHLTYDITIPAPVMLGREFNKTAGHYHANKPGLKIAHPEMYEILLGQCLFLLQKMDEDFKEVLDVIAVEAGTGDKIIYPPNYGHILINLGSDALVTANWLSTDYKPLYQPVADYHGMAYYVVASKDKKYELVPNSHYHNVPPVRTINKKAYESFPIVSDEPMYTKGMRNPKLLEFLSFPEKYQKEFAGLTSRP
ncbi:MAG TPA: glucose-6-phosphate isomerase family protein [Patescibacteria group bacterium]|jgi:glucose-6-phosphate isomerase|nr:glucose-6-phosphate isomerase family protein [Patescibacteria group bacterium]